jgi:hypothetical protein
VHRLSVGTKDAPVDIGRLLGKFFQQERRKTEGEVLVIIDNFTDLPVGLKNPGCRISSPTSSG